MRYTKEDLSRAFEDIHSGNLVISMYVDNLENQNKEFKQQLAKYEESSLSSEDFNILMKSVENPQVNEKLKEFLLRPSAIVEFEESCTNCKKLEQQLEFAVEQERITSSMLDSCQRQCGKANEDVKELKQQLEEAKEIINKIASDNPIHYCWGLRTEIEKLCNSCDEFTDKKCHMNPYSIAKQFLNSLESRGKENEQ